MFNYLKKGISTPIVIGIILVLIVVIGGFYVYENIPAPEEGEEIGEEKGIPEEQSEEPGLPEQGNIIEKEEISEGPEEEITPEEEGPQEVSDTTRKGTISEDEIWSGQIDVTGDILVEEGTTLTILPGTQIIVSANKDLQNLFGSEECEGIKNFDLLEGTRTEESIICGVHQNEPYRDEANHISIVIRGTLEASGTEDNRIVFKSDSLNPTIYDWNRLEIHNGVLSYANVENYRVLEPRGDDVEISHNNLKNIGECGICANSGVYISFNTISYAGHELIDMHNKAPNIYNNEIGPNPNKSCITIDGGSPQIVGNTIHGCGGAISLLKPLDDPTFEENVLQNNTFANNGNTIWHDY